MCDHYTADACIKHRPERNQLHRIELCHGFINNRQIQMRIHIHITMSRKMFGTAMMPASCIPFIYAHQTDTLFVFTKRTVADHRIFRIVIDIHHRRIIHLYTHTRMLPYPVAILVNQVNGSCTAPSIICRGRAATLSTRILHRFRHQ